jgi:hypothetical protein
MISNARAESDARSARSREGTTHGESTSDYGDEREKRSSVPLGESDGEGSGYEDGFEGLRTRHGVQPMPKRDSI